MEFLAQLRGTALLIEKWSELDPFSKLLTAIVA